MKLAGKLLLTGMNRADVKLPSFSGSESESEDELLSLSEPTNTGNQSTTGNQFNNVYCKEPV